MSSTQHGPSDAAPTVGAFAVLRRGISSSPALREGTAVLFGLAIVAASSRLAVPVLLQYSLDRGVLGAAGVRPRIVIVACLIAAAILTTTAVLTFVLTKALARRAEQAVADLRTQALGQVHRLSLADHNESLRGNMLARVTSDANAIGHFAEWALLIWVIDPMLLIGIFAVLAFFSWQLAVIAFLTFLLTFPVMRFLQKHMYDAHEALRTDVGSMLSTFGESLSGADTVRANGVEERTRTRQRAATRTTYRTRLRANRYMSSVYVIGDLFGGVAFAAVLVTGLAFHDRWGITAGELTACLFLISMLEGPVSGLGESLSETQAAAAGWGKILGLLDQQPDITEPANGHTIRGGPVGIEVDDVTFSYRGAVEPVLRDVSVDLPPGANIAVVGETGSGKTTFAKLLCRLSDPTGGEIRLNGTALPTVSPASRLASVRIVPQDGFLFDRTVGENIRFGRPGASDADIAAAIDLIGLNDWVGRLDAGLDTPVGERGGNLSVGERQLVALARAALADPGLLILDEATSAVDPETDQALTTALRRLAENRTLVSIAHRLATAESADLILVFDHGVIVEQGPHESLVGAGGVYTRLHQAWQGATRSD